jgi:hypothetical protein
MAGQLGQTKRPKSRGKKGLHNKDPKNHIKKNPGPPPPPPEKKVREIVVEMMPAEDFNKEFFKVTNDTEYHRGFQWHDGWNRDTKEFNPYIDCGPGGLYFTDIVNLERFIEGGTRWVRVVHPDLEKNEFARIKDTPIKWKSHAVFAEERKNLWVLETWKFLLSKAAQSGRMTPKGHLDLLDIPIQRSLRCKPLLESFFMDIGPNGYVHLLLRAKGSYRDRLERVQKVLPEVRGSLDSRVRGEIREMLTDLEKGCSYCDTRMRKDLWAEVGSWSFVKRTFRGLFKKKKAEVFYKNTHLSYLSGVFNG